MTFLKKNKSLIIGLIVVFFFSFLFIYSGDDWQWGTTSIDLNFMAHNVNLNGRYLGNILVTLLCKNIIFRALIYTIVLNGIVLLIHKFTKFSYPLIWLMLTLMPIPILRQGIVWTSGFANYATSSFLLLLIIFIIPKIYQNKFKNKLIPIFLIILFFASTLFIENLSVYLLLLTFILNIIYLKQNKKINYYLLISFIATLGGNIVMFSQSAYHNLLTNEASRSLGSYIISNSVSVVHKYLAFDNLVLILMLSTCLYLIYYQNKNKITNKFINLIFLYQAFYVGYSLISHFAPNWQILINYTPYFNTIITYVYLISVIALIILLAKVIKIDFNFSLTLASIIGMFGPLLVVNPVGARNFLTIYILEVIFVLKLLNNINYPKNIVHKISAIGLIIMFTYYLSIYGYIAYTSNKRLNYIKEMANSETILVPTLPYNSYIHHPDFNDEYYEPYYKRFYHIPEDVKFTFTNYENWVTYLSK